jgi:phage gpG-like protein
VKRIGSFDFKKVLKNLEVKKKEIPVIIANNSLNFFDDNFRRKGFLDKSVDKWKPRKPSKNRKPILIKTGRLRRSLRVKSATFHRIEISTDVPYAKIQNEGGTIEKKASTKILHFKKIDGFKNVRGKKTVVMGLGLSKVK